LTLQRAARLRANTISHGKIPLAALVCPDCRTALSLGDCALKCDRCSASFSTEHSLLTLYPPSRALEIAGQLAAFRSPHSSVRGKSFFRALIPPNPICDAGGAKREALVREKTATGLVLNLGSKDARWGEHVVNLDIVAPLHSGVDVLADISALPFADASVDGVICTYVLEHVADARVCIDEITRVIKPGGTVYIAIPFLFPTHPDPLDRWRWTLDGLRHAMHAFDECAAGCSGGPVSTYVSIVPTLLASMFSNFYLFNAIRFALGWMLWPLKFLDYFASGSKNEHMAAANFYFLGKKK
jgi:SAM-dependent methyltransferase